MSSQPPLSMRVLPAVAIISALVIATPHAAFGVESAGDDATGQFAQAAINAGLSESAADVEILEALEENAPEVTGDTKQEPSLPQLVEVQPADEPSRAGSDETAEDSVEGEGELSDDGLLVVAKEPQNAVDIAQADAKATITMSAASDGAEEAVDETPHVELDGHKFSLDSAVAGRGALDVNGASSKLGANVQLWLSNDSSAQRWIFRKAETDKKRPFAVSSG